MSVVGERERRLILDLLAKRISEKDFYQAFPMTPGEGSQVGYGMLAHALKVHDATSAEFGLYLGGLFGTTDEYIDVLLELANAQWHQIHELVIDSISGLRSPKSVDTLVRTATTHFPYRDYDEFNSLGVKCAWTLAKIGTAEAIAGLRTLAASGDPNLVRTASSLLRRLEGLPPLQDDDS